MLVYQRVDDEFPLFLFLSLSLCIHSFMDNQDDQVISPARIEH